MAITTKAESLLTQAELDNVNEVYNLITGDLPILLTDDVKSFLLEKFNENSKKVLQTTGTPAYLFLDAMARDAQLLSGAIVEACSRMLYTQSSGEDLSITAMNFGHTRIEAKKSTMVITLTASKQIIISENTSFTDGASNVWLATGGSTIVPANTPTRISLEARDSGVVNYISPITPTNTIANLTKYEVDTSSIVLGRNQESDIELKNTIASSGVQVFGTDDSCKRALLQQSMVLSAFVYTNPLQETTSKLGVDIDFMQRYICVRVSNSNISQEEADLIAQTAMTNTIYGDKNFQIPADKKVSKYFGLTEEQLTLPISEGGAGLAGVDTTSNCVLVRNTDLYGNYGDIYFYIAKATKIVIRLEIRYSGNYTSTEKENMAGSIKQEVSQTISELSQVGTSILTSSIAERLLTQTDLSDKLTIRSLLLKKYVADDTSTDNYTQSLDADAFEYFEIYSTAADSYAGVLIVES